MNNENNQRFLEICREFKQAMLVTKNDSGQLMARPMFIAEFESSGDLWFATDRQSEKVEEIQQHPSVCVSMTQGGKYASISGTAEIVNDQSKIDELWSEPWKVWFPDGKDDDRLVLIKVNADFGEYWMDAGAEKVKYWFKAAKAYASGDRPDIDEKEHGTADL